MTERVDHDVARILLLRMVQDLLDLEDEERPNPNPDTLEITKEDLERFGNDRLGWSLAETSRLFKRLVREGFMEPYRNDMGKDVSLLELNGIIQYAWIEDLTEKGRRAKGTPVNFDEYYQLGGEIFSVSRGKKSVRYEE
jgi:hypothetical protein